MFVDHKMAPKPGTAGGSYPTGAVSSYQSMGAAGGFNMSGGYDEMSASVNHDYSKYINPQTGKLSVGGSGEKLVRRYCIGLLLSIFLIQLWLQLIQTWVPVHSSIR